MRQAWLTWWFVCLSFVMMTAIVGVFGYTSAPRPTPLALIVFLGAALLCLVNPSRGLYVTVALALCGDEVTSYWYPITKNMSAAESILFLHPALAITPLEVLGASLMLGWIGLCLAQRRWVLRRGPLNRPVAAFTAFALLGFLWGVGRGGDYRIALWEIRPTLLLPMLFFLIYNLFDRWTQYRRLVAIVVVAQLVNALIALDFLTSKSPAQREALESLIDHPAALPMNMVILLLLASVLLPGGERRWRRWLLLIIGPVGTVYLWSQRRAGFVALVAALLLLMVLLVWTNRKAMIRAAPVMLVVAVGYLGAFWNTEGVIGFPAQAVKSVIAPDQLSDKDSGSDLYRYIETYNIKYTIRTNPIMGIGYGQQFLRPIPLPAISQFLLAQYRTHNSVLWIWMKTGVGGFMAMVLMFGVAMRTGARAMLRTARTPQGPAVVTTAGFVLMYAVFTYVDIAWDTRSMVLLALSFAHLSNVVTADDAGEESASAGAVRAPEELQPEPELALSGAR